MNELYEQIQNREKQLLELKKEKEKALRKAPKGFLRVCCNRNRTQFYLREDPKDFNGTYIKAKDKELARSLAQKDYDQKVLSAAAQELAAIHKYYQCFPEKNVEEIFASIHHERQKLVVPVEECDEEFIQKWRAVEYQGKSFQEGTGFYTDRGEKVRSKSELIIANLLHKYEIPYRYEYPCYLNSWGIVYPDFTTLNVRMRKEIYWEHLGMMDDSEYVEKAIKKMELYENNEILLGDRLVLTYETKKHPINPKAVENIIRHYLK